MPDANADVAPESRRSADVHPTPTSPSRGHLVVFEGPDGVGKTTLVEAVQGRLSSEIARPVVQLSFPGRQLGTLGRHVYELHHDPGKFGVSSIAPASLQLLHVAAHLDTIEYAIRPRLSRGEVVLLDRYWWSTWVYGVVGGVERNALKAMIGVELAQWGNIRPDMIIVVTRAKSLREGEDQSRFALLSAEYRAIAAKASHEVRVATVANDGDFSDTLHNTLGLVRSVVAPTKST